MRWMTMNPEKRFEVDFADSARKFGHYVRIREKIGVSEAERARDGQIVLDLTEV